MGCCEGDKCKKCPEGEEASGKKKCKSDTECHVTQTEGFANQKLHELTTNGYYKATGEFINNSIDLENTKKEHPLSNWLHQENYHSNGMKVKKGPVYVYDKIVEKYGEPDVIANQPKGICIWYIEQKDGDVHHSIELKDQYVGHCVPAKHNDFLYSYIKVYVPPEKIRQVLAVSGSVGYDGLQKLLYARCASFEANMATLASVFLVLRNKDPNYVYQIKNRFASYENNLKFVEEQLKKNQKKYRKKINSPYYDLAFPDGCNK